MGDYSIFLVLPAGDCVRTMVCAADDRDVIEQIWRIDGFAVAEVWLGTRLVARIDQPIGRQQIDMPAC